MENASSEYMETLRFLSLSVSMYEIIEEKLVESMSGERGRFIAFFSRSFLRNRKWVVFPLWEGDLRMLNFEDGKSVEFLEKISSYCLRKKQEIFHVAIIEKADWTAHLQESYAATFVTGKFNILDKPLGELFETTPTQVPNWGNNFLWPDSQEFLIYTEGDNAAFIAGKQEEIEAILGIQYLYCKKRFSSIYATHDYIEAHTRFCDEFQTFPG